MRFTPGYFRVVEWLYASPIFVGSGGYGAPRSDLAAVFGSQFTNAGSITFIAGLPSGTYDLVVYAHSTVTGTFNQSRIVRIVIP
jgi:hypothetical protein